MAGVYRQSFDETSNAQETEILGGTDQTKIGNVTDSLKVNVTNSLTVDAVPRDGNIATYSASVTGLVAANNPTDIFTITGDTMRTVRVTYLEVTATQTTAAQRDIQILRRSTANTGGTSVTRTAVKHDTSGPPAAAATVRSYTANPTLGTLVGTIRARKVFIATTSTNSDEFVLDFGTRPSKAIVLRDSSEVLAINLNGVSSAGNSFDISIEWTEE